MPKKPKPKGTPLNRIAVTAATTGMKSQQKLLYGAEQFVTHNFTYKINSGGELGVKEQGNIQVTFKNGNFAYASFPFQGPYTRNGWRILAAINQKIEEIEAGMAGANQGVPETHYAHGAAGTCGNVT